MIFEKNKTGMNAETVNSWRLMPISLRSKELNMTEIKKISVSTRMSGDWNGIYLTGSL